MNADKRSQDADGKYIGDNDAATEAGIDVDVVLALRQLYHEVLTEPLPDEFIVLLESLDGDRNDRFIL